MTLAEQLTALAGARIWFGHQSTGWNILVGPTFPTVTAGVAHLAQGSGLTVAQRTLSAAIAVGTFGHDEIGANGDPKGKIAAFNTRVRAYLASFPGQLDYAFLKLCWIDFAVTDTDVWIDTDLWPTYRNTLDALITDFPGVKFVHCTAPLMSTGDAQANVKRERYNNLLRAYYPAADIFDVADLECTGKDGRRVYCNPDGTGTFYDAAAGHVRMLSDDWAQVDNGHLAADGCDQVGAALIGFLHAHTTATITRMTAASRVWGVAPLLVFFDAVNVTADGSAENAFDWSSATHQPVDMEGAQYTWDFGDAAAGMWAPTGRSKNAATGYTAAHVFETPGVYVVQVRVTDPAGGIYLHEQTVTVVPFSGTTYYVGAGGNDAADGLSDATRFLTFARGMTAFNGGPSRRVLFRRGDTFQTPATTTTLTAVGSCIIGAYGVGAAPVINSNLPEVPTGGDATIVVRSEDTRLLDLDITYFTATNDSPTAISYSNSEIRHTLVMRVKTTGFRVGLGNGDGASLARPPDGAGWVDCEVVTPYVNGMYVGGRRISVMGCNIHDIVTSHVLRVWQAHKGVISNNRLWNPGPTRHALKMHGGAFGDGRAATRWVTISDNVARGVSWVFTVGPQDAGVDERVAHVVLERNRLTGDATVGVDLLIWASQVMVRNNIFDGTGGGGSYNGIFVGARGIEPPPQVVRIYNNTIVRNDACAEFYGVEVTAAATGVIMRNNLISAPLASYKLALTGTGAGAVTADHNLLSDTPGFTNAAGADYTLAVGSVAIDAGATLAEVSADFVGTARAAPYDLGAYDATTPGGGAQNFTVTAAALAAATSLSTAAAALSAALGGGYDVIGRTTLAGPSGPLPLNASVAGADIATATSLGDAPAALSGRTSFTTTTADLFTTTALSSASAQLERLDTQVVVADLVVTTGLGTATANLPAPPEPPAPPGPQPVTGAPTHLYDEDLTEAWGTDAEVEVEVEHGMRSVGFTVEPDVVAVVWRGDPGQNAKQWRGASTNPAAVALGYARTAPSAPSVATLKLHSLLTR